MILFFSTSMIMAQTINSAKTDSILNKIVETVEFKDAPMIDVLRLLAHQNELNLIIGPDTMGNVSLRFSGVTLKAALDAILRSKGFSYQVYDNILLVMRPDTLERARGLGLETKLFQLKYASASDVKASIDSIKVLSPWGYTNVFYRGEGKTTPTRSDVLIVTDHPLNLKKVADLIEQLDRPVRQVAIDVQFVETILGDDQKVGIDWQQLLKVQGSYQGKTKWVLGEEVSPTGGGVLEFGTLSSTNFAAVLDILLSNRNSKLLSQPRITTLDNQQATISVGTSVWIEKRTGTGAMTEMQVTYEERLVPIQLVVVPHILHNDKILLEMQPMVEEITGWQQASSGMRLPTISSRKADSRVEVRDGETAIIGGLIRNSVLNDERKVWLLGSIPLIGHLFRYKTQNIERTELSIFITPRIIKDDNLTVQPTPPPPLFAEDKAKKPDLVVQTALDTISADKIIKKSKPPELIDLKDYFPIHLNKRWIYQWSDDVGNSWVSQLIITGKVELNYIAEESIPEGRYKSKSRTIYKWSDDGLMLLHKVNIGRDSTIYENGRIVIPSKMLESQPNENRAKWRLWKQDKTSTEGEIIQVQTLLARGGIETPAGYFKDCVLIETFWYDAQDKLGIKRRKVIWYAKGVGPVKVESDIPLDATTLKGKISGVLTSK